eukprot:2715694-Heterocapsa_arctica.AAC.1
MRAPAGLALLNDRADVHLVLRAAVLVPALALIEGPADRLPDLGNIRAPGLCELPHGAANLFVAGLLTSSLAAALVAAFPSTAVLAMSHRGATAVAAPAEVPSRPTAHRGRGGPLDLALPHGLHQGLTVWEPSPH